MTPFRTGRLSRFQLNPIGPEPALEVKVTGLGVKYYFFPGLN